MRPHWLSLHNRLLLRSASNTWQKSKYIRIHLDRQLPNLISTTGIAVMGWYVGVCNEISSRCWESESLVWGESSTGEVQKCQMVSVTLT